ncbi:hypothetical protein BJ970_001087 [Saccharopolyspora phatthalungensis]|uniref:Uncharacterized protein n=1 Tax=Saccharopolyspora phatthalungensis TaxID=664693 RepID=A0A840Q9R7_9PSEU|nr:hypothetical protein [Saccharopolyspora phatthalungensis]
MSFPGLASCRKLSAYPAVWSLREGVRRATTAPPPIGSPGKIETLKEADGTWRAFTRFRSRGRPGREAAGLLAGLDAFVLDHRYYRGSEWHKRGHCGHEETLPPLAFFD